jgi:hypothetical protein
MILLNDLQKYIFPTIDKINKEVKKNKKIKSQLLLHGSGAKVLQNNSRIYATDIDAEYWVECVNKKETYNHVINVINYLLKNKFSFVKLRFGKDTRFIFDFKIDKKGCITNYDYEEISKRFKKLLKDKVIVKKDYEYLTEYLLKNDKISLIPFEKLKLRIDEYKQITWNEKEFKNESKIHFGIKYLLSDLWLTDTFLSSFIYEFDKGNYVNFDFSVIVFYFKNKNKIDFNIFENMELDLKTNLYSEIYQQIQKETFVYGEENGSRYDGFRSYKGIYKNYVQEKYLKILKRLKNLIQAGLFNKELNNVNKYLANKKYNHLLWKTKKEINDIVCREEYTCLNQLKNRIDIILFFLDSKKINKLEIKKLIFELLRDGRITCNYGSDELQGGQDIKNICAKLESYHTSNSNKEKNELIKFLKIYKKNMFCYLNMKVLPDLIQVYNKVKNILPFQIELPLPKL